MTENTPPQGSLEQLGISLETLIEETVLTETAAKNVRFHAVRTPTRSKPLGYSFGDVDKFVQDIVAPSLAWYQDALHARDKDVHRLGGELDQANANIAGLEKQIESVKYNANIKQGLQSYQEDKETVALMERVQALEAENETLRNNTAPQELDETLIQPYLDAIAERDEYIATLTTQYEELYEAHNTILEEQQNAPEPVDMTNFVEKTVVEDLQNQLTRNQSDLNDAQTSLLETEARLINFKTEKEALDARVSELSQQLEQATDNTEHEEAIRTLTQQLTDATTEYGTLQTKYDADTAKLAADANELQETVVALQTSLSEAQTALADTNNTDSQISEEYVNSLNEHIAQITEQYGALEKQYLELYEQYQILDATKADTPAPAVSEDGYTVEELQAYIQQITDQYNELLAQYNTLNEQKNSSTNNAEIGQLKVELEAKDAKIARLEAELDEIKNLEDEDETPVNALPPLLTEEKNKKTEVPTQFTNLPEGIRPEDLI